MSLHDDKDLTQATATRTHGAAIARFVLDQALQLDIRVGTDGSEIVLLAPLRLPRETRRWFEIQLDKYRKEVITTILQENTGGRA